MSSSSRPSRASSAKARPDPLLRLARRGSDILPHHREAAERLRAAWERRDEVEARRGLRVAAGVFRPLLLAVVIEPVDVATWCRSHDPPRDRRTMVGALTLIMDKLASCYGIDRA